MAIRPEIALAVRSANIGPALDIFNRTLQSQRGNELAQAQNARQEALQPGILELQQQRIAEGQQGIDTGGLQLNTARDVAEFTSVAHAAQRMQADLQSGNFAAVESFLSNRLGNLQAQGRNTEDTEEALQMLATNPQELLSSTNNILSIAKERGIGPRQQQTPAGSDFDKFQALQAKARESGDPADQKAADQFGQRANFTRLSTQQKADISVDTAGKKKAATLEAEAALASRIAGEKAAGAQAIALSGKAFDRLEPIARNIASYGTAIQLLDDGAKTGRIASMLPSFSKASIGLDNLQKSLGLDVVGSTTFGALSQGELNLALDVALPTNLSPPDLRVWLVSKQNAQQKLKGYIEEAATFLGTPGNTVADFVQLRKARTASPQQEVAPQQAQAQAAPQAAPQQQAAVQQQVAAPQAQAAPQSFTSSGLGREVSEQDIADTLAANPGVTREQLFQQLGIN